MEKISNHFGAIIKVNKTELQEKLFYNKIIEYIGEYHLLLIKDLVLSVKEFLKFSENLGEVIPHDILKYRHPKYEMLSYVTNVDENGNLDEFGSKIRASDWHTDGSFRKIPYSYTILYSLNAPSKGGNTEFNNMVQSYKELNDKIRSKISTLTGFHKRGEGWKSINPPPPLSQSQKSSGLFEGNSHPLVIKNPISRKDSLYINPSHLNIINNLSKEDSNNLLDDLSNNTIKEKFQYSHKWSEKDLIIWDQRDLLHRASPIKVIKEKRTMIRSMILNKPHRI